MAYTVAIRDNTTQEIRVCTLDIDWDESSEFWWTEGNFSCDCNRYLEFERAAGREPDPDCDDVECGFTQYTALYAELADGTRISLDSQEGNEGGDNGRP